MIIYFSIGLEFRVRELEFRVWELELFHVSLELASSDANLTSSVVFSSFPASLTVAMLPVSATSSSGLLIEITDLTLLLSPRIASLRIVPPLSSFFDLRPEDSEKEKTDRDDLLFDPDLELFSLFMVDPFLILLDFLNLA